MGPPLSKKRSKKGPTGKLCFRVCNPRNNRTIGPRRSAAGAGRDALPARIRGSTSDRSCPVYPPPMVDALRRVRRRTSGTRLWTCDAGRAGTRIRSEALLQRLLSDVLRRIARERVPPSPKLVVKPRGLLAETLCIRPATKTILICLRFLCGLLFEVFLKPERLRHTAIMLSLYVSFTLDLGPFRARSTRHRGR